MKIEKQKLKEDLSRDLYWGRIYFTSGDESKKSKVLLCASFEYMQRFFKKDAFQDTDFDPWLEKVVEKWMKLEDDIFNQDIHYDVYATTREGEANGLDFLLEKAKS